MLHESLAHKIALQLFAEMELLACAMEANEWEQFKSATLELSIQLQILHYYLTEISGRFC